MDTEPAVTEAVALTPSVEHFRFTGSGREYFGIWIVNLLLTILTLGLYSPWAKVRRLQYFYRNIELAGASFEYHGRPIAILKGRLIALGLLLLYHFSTTYVSKWTAVVLLILALALPWLLHNALRFRLANSSYRGLHFSFHGSLAQAYLVFLVYGMLMIFTAYLAAPFFHQRLKRYQHAQARYGNAAFSFTAGIGRFYKIDLPFMLLFLLLLAAALVPSFTLMAAVKAGTKPDPHLVSYVTLVFFAVFVIGSLILTPLWQAAMQNLIWNHTGVASHRFVSRVSGWRLVWINLSNLLLVGLSLGLFMPWAAVRVATYRASCLSLELNGAFDVIAADDPQRIGAAGEETAELFDIEIGL